MASAIKLFETVRNGNKVVDTRDLALSVNLTHKRFYQDTILYHKKTVEEITKQSVELAEDKTGKRGRPEKFAYLTYKQAAIYLNCAKTTPEVLMMINELSTHILGSAQPKPQSYEWSKYSQCILKGKRLFSHQLDYGLYYHTDEMKTLYFSPDQVFSELLAKTELILGYTLPIEVNIDTESKKESLLYHLDILEEPLLPEEDEDIEFGEEETPILDKNIPINVEDLQEFLDYVLCLNWIILSEAKLMETNKCEDCDTSLNVWTTRPIDLDEKLEYARALTEDAYRAYWDDDTDESTYKEFVKRLTFLHNNYFKPMFKTVGLKPHQQFNEWLQLTAQTNNLDGFPSPYELKTKMRDVYYHVTEYATADEQTKTATALEDLPVFHRIALYPNQWRKWFDYYVENVWYPEHAAQWIQSVDPTGFKQLQQAVTTASKTQLSILPSSFVTALQATLPQAPEQKQIAPSN